MTASNRRARGFGVIAALVLLSLSWSTLAIVREDRKDVLEMKRSNPVQRAQVLKALSDIAATKATCIGLELEFRKFKREVEFVHRTRR